MLKGIPAILPPDLLKVLMEMGHGDELVIGDGNFPAASSAAPASYLVRCNGHEVPEVLAAIVQLLPLDQYVPRPAALMQVAEKDQGGVPPKRWDEYREIIQQAESTFRGEYLEAIQQQPDSRFQDFELLERFAFYQRAKACYAVVSTGDSEIYANIILKKGIIAP